MVGYLLILDLESLICVVNILYFVFMEVIMIDYISYVKISNALTDLTTATCYSERSIIESL